MSDNETEHALEAATDFELWPIDRPKPYTNNPRHNENAVGSVAESIRLFGFNQPIAVDENGVILAGHTRMAAARELGLETVPVVVRRGLSESEKKAYRIRDNRSAELSEWDTPRLALEFSALNLDGFDATLTGFSGDEIGRVLDGEDDEGNGAGAGGSDEIPDAEEVPATTRPGDLYRLGRHRLLCGDARSSADLERLLDVVDAPAPGCLHADPPYGMGKETDGVANDNLYGDKLDAFQLDWLRLWIPRLAPAAGVYVWGNAPALWRLWYVAGLSSLDRLTVRNEIVWDKGGVPGMASEELTQYPEASERCLFMQRGTTFLGNVNKDDFFEGWEPVRAYLEAEATGAGLTPAKLLELCGVKMFGHWFRKSQFALIPEKHYATLADAFPGHFLEPWQGLRRQFEAAEREKRAARAFFDNAHSVMRDVWDFPRVLGDDRHGHATPKPLALMERILRSSVPDAGLVLEPFLGSGSTLIAAETTGRVCYGMEIAPRHCDVIVRRWETVTGLRARRIPAGQVEEPGEA